MQYCARARGYKTLVKTLVPPLPRLSHHIRVLAVASSIIRTATMAESRNRRPHDHTPTPGQRSTSTRAAETLSALFHLLSRAVRAVCTRTRRQSCEACACAAHRRRRVVRARSKRRAAPTRCMMCSLKMRQTASLWRRRRSWYTSRMTPTTASGCRRCVRHTCARSPDVSHAARAVCAAPAACAWAP